ncbi:MAG TPA: aminotransferase class V-fold PLP-dependent enzyme, partial [Candidatus Kapabacteria bacterium]|nr:aminotransferase class V-fold PLP-dependent enzyme [Candidatus Kapabacteria bacterium]
MSNIDERLLEIRQDFPVLNRLVYGKPLVYLDNAATTQKPKCVISAISDYYLNYNSNIHRGVHRLSQEATDEYEKSRKIIKEFINAKNASEIIFTRGTTEGINLVANSFVRPRLNEGDEVLITYIEHHSNIVPWQIVCEETGAKLKVAPINDAGELVFEEFEKLLTEKVKFVSVVYVSNSLGTINP